MTASAPQSPIDLNADFGEATTPEQRAVEDAVIESVTSINIACGGHAGDEASMRHAVRIAARYGVAIGAHPSYPDRANFGRASMNLEPAALRTSIAQQISVLASIARSEGASLAHCKPHGALYHAASTDESIALAVFQACCEVDPGMRLVGQAGSRAIAWWRTWGAIVAEEAFVDRAYEPDGLLRSRTRPDALITDPDAAAEQALRIATTRTVRCGDDALLALRADTLCIHVDTPGATAMSARVAQSLRSAGVTLRSLP